MSGNMCPGQGMLEQLLEAQLPATEWTAIERHLRVCPQCQHHLTKFRPSSALSFGEMADQSRAQLSQSVPVAETPSRNPNAFAQAERTGSPADQAASRHDMRPTATAANWDSDGPARVRHPQSRTARVWTGVAAAAVLAAAFALGPVRSAAAQILERFRINEVRAIPFDPAAMANIEDLAAEYADLVHVEAVDGVELGDAALAAVEVPDIDAASKMTGFTMRTPGGRTDAARVRVSPGGTLRLRVDGARLKDFGSLMGVDPDRIPAEVGEALVEAEAGVEAAFSTDSGVVHVRAVPAPRISLPPGWDSNALGELFLAGLGMSGAQARAMADAIDWGSTLLVPVPMGHMSAADVRVDGVYGVALQLPRRQATRSHSLVDTGTPEQAGGFDNLGANATLVIWQKNGFVNALTGAHTIEELVAMADSLR
jgi:hypothetical protein